MPLFPFLVVVLTSDCNTRKTVSLGGPGIRVCLGISGRSSSIVNSETNWKIGMRKGREVHESVIALKGLKLITLKLLKLPLLGVGYVEENIKLILFGQVGWRMKCHR